MLKIVQDCLRPKQYGVKQSGAPPTSRTILIRHSATVEKSKRLLEQSLVSNTTPGSLPLCTVVFELTDNSTDAMFIAKLVRRHKFKEDHRFRVAYNRVYPCTKSSHSILLFLETSASFKGIRKPSAQPIRSLTRTRILAHNIRILSARAERPPPASLTHGVVLEIARFAIGQHRCKWRSTLLSIALVCKAWSHVVDLFFRLPRSNCSHKPSAPSVARSLTLTPERVRYVREFVPWSYREDSADDSERYMETCLALVQIANLATSVKDVQITRIHKSLVQEFVLALSRLRKVETCVVYNVYPHNRRKYVVPSEDMSRPVGMDDIQTFIAKWSSLRELDASKWDKDTEPTV